jgi:hypothetical protein
MRDAGAGVAGGRASVATGAAARVFSAAGGHRGPAFPRQAPARARARLARGSAERRSAPPGFCRSGVGGRASGAGAIATRPGGSVAREPCPGAVFYRSAHGGRGGVRRRRASVRKCDGIGRRDHRPGGFGRSRCSAASRAASARSPRPARRRSRLAGARVVSGRLWGCRRPPPGDTPALPIAPAASRLTLRRVHATGQPEFRWSAGPSTRTQPTAGHGNGTEGRAPRPGRPSFPAAHSGGRAREEPTLARGSGGVARGTPARQSVQRRLRLRSLPQRRTPSFGSGCGSARPFVSGSGCRLTGAARAGVPGSAVTGGSTGARRVGGEVAGPLAPRWLRAAAARRGRRQATWRGRPSGSRRTLRFRVRGDDGAPRAA